MSYPPREHRQKKQCVQATQLSLMNGAEVNTLAFSVFLMPAAKKQRADPFLKKKKKLISYIYTTGIYCSVGISFGSKVKGQKGVTNQQQQAGKM